MKRATKWVGLAIASAVCVTSVAAFTACENNTAKPAEYKVTYYDGDEILKTETVKEGEKAVKWTPEKDDYTFVDWYATPNFGFKFDFDAPITENKSAFAQWTAAQQSEDEREFYIVGSGTSPILLSSNWGKVFDSTTVMTKTAGKNEYTYTLDLYEGDLFQFALNESWHHQRGVGYLTTTKLADDTVAFSGASTIGDNSSYRLNIKCEYAGNYTFTLTTHPDDDTYETENPSYTEANKEAFNINPLDSISWVRNGDVEAGDVQTVTDYYIKGAGITAWKDVYNASTKMTETNGVYALEVYLKENEEFMFTSVVTVGTESGTGTEYLRATNLDEASKAYIGQKPNANMLANANGTYTFTYTKATGVLSVAFDADKTPVATDYYIDGTFADGLDNWNGYCFNPDFMLTETAADSGIYEIKNVSLKADSQIIIQAFKAGSTERGEWGTESYNGLGSYNYTYLVGGGNAFSAVGDGNNNIKVLTAGVYNITFDSYSKIITLEDANVQNDAYIVGTINSWTVLNDFKMTLNENTYTIEMALEAGAEFGVRVMQGESTTQKYWFAASAMSDASESFDVTGNNIKCVIAGTYVITCTVTDNVGVITIVPKAA